MPSGTPRRAPRGLTLSDLGAPVDWPGADVDRGARRGRARAHPRVGAPRQQPEPDRSLGQHPQGGRRGGRGDRPPDRHRPGAQRCLDSRRKPGTRMHIKFLARGTGSARGRCRTTSLERGTRPGSRAKASRSFGANPHRVAVGGGHSGVRAQVHLRRDRLGTGGRADRRSRSSAVLDAFEETAWAGTRTRPLRLGGGAPP